jgi:UDP-N-acetylglucosamine 2-epimerase (non-hydrolysing)
VGNLMIDTLLAHRAKAEASSIRARLGLDGSRPYALVTLHRPRNVDHPAALESLLRALDRLAASVAVIFPIHPRTLRNTEAAGLEEYLKALRVRIVDPLGYLDFLNLMSRAAFVITDSGGIQEETTILGIPCLTVRDNTERPVTLEQGTNQLVGCDPQCLIDAAAAILARPPKSHTTPTFWDGHAAERIVRILVEQYGSTSVRRPLPAQCPKSVSTS